MDYNFTEIFHCLLIFNNQHEPIFTFYDDYISKIMIQPYQSRFFDNSIQQCSVSNILMQLFSPILASQAAMFENMKVKFNRIVLANDKVLIIHRVQHYCLIILLSDTCPYRHHYFVILKKLENIEWIISSFYGLCWNYMKSTNDKWLRVILKELLLMDHLEFNILFGSVEKLDLNNKKLTEKVFESLVTNSRYLKHINERRLKHQLILTGSKLYILFSHDNSSYLKQRHILCFIIICNAVFNRFSRMRYINSIYKASNINVTDGCMTDNNAEHSADEAEVNNNLSITSESSLLNEIKFTKSFNGIKTDSSTTASISDLDPFVLWIENKDGHKYRIIKLFLNLSDEKLVPCNLHLLKLTRNVIYIGLEEDIENNMLIANLDKSIRLLRKIINEQIHKTDTISMLQNRVKFAIEKLIYFNVLHSQKLKHVFKQIMKEIYNLEACERLIKELLRILEAIYVHYYLSCPVRVNERLCKSVLRCFMSVKREIYEFVSILSVKAHGAIPLTSLYSIYPGLIHFAFVVRRPDSFIISPFLDPEQMGEYNLDHIHLLTEMSRKLALLTKVADFYSNNNYSNNNQNSDSWRQIELRDNTYRCTYLLRWSLITDKITTELELVLIHKADTLRLVVRKHFSQLFNQFLSDIKGSSANLMKLTS